ncbi:MAG: bifunctional UDP-4-keto-pentose/UDP-xylose synthase [Acidimicrobiia bacterium]|nr:bifunctional UDP-4-keto-pentose/UDP-xylose synthase [Acidimicrobiia bacterium]MDX2468480.1 bifunctional UDP-4-keto-pentose/UDP-xylose synthase [Acidimicrobiia bacterium]
MKIAIFGVGGFVGSNLVEHLIEEGVHDVVGMDVTNNKLAGIEGANFKYVEGNVGSDVATAEDLTKWADVVVDLIAYANPSIYVEAPLDVVELNFFENMKILNYCLKYQTRLIQYSTSEVYGKRTRDQEYTEDTSDLVMGPVTKQRWIYASSKQLLERIIHGHGLRGDLEYSVIRPFNFIGPRFDYLVPAGAKGGPRVFSHFVSAMITGGPIHLVDGGGQHRCFTHIKDASEAFSSILEHPDARNEIFNIGNPDTNITMRGLAEMMGGIYTELTGKAPSNEIIEISGEDFYGVGYEDMDRVPPNVDKLKALGWAPKHDLDSIFREAIAFYLEPERHASIV